MLKLLQLEPRFLTYERDGIGHVFQTEVTEIDYAQGVQFLCPACFTRNGGRIGTHRVTCWSRSRGVPDFATPAPGRWRMVGTGLHDLSLNAENPGGMRSVQLLSGCMWHGYVTNGEVTDA